MLARVPQPGCWARPANSPVGPAGAPRPPAAPAPLRSPPSQAFELLPLASALIFVVAGPLSSLALAWLITARPQAYARNRTPLLTLLKLARLLFMAKV